MLFTNDFCEREITVFKGLPKAHGLCPFGAGLPSVAEQPCGALTSRASRKDYVLNKVSKLVLKGLVEGSTHPTARAEQRSSRGQQTSEDCGKSRINPNLCDRLKEPHLCRDNAISPASVTRP